MVRIIRINFHFFVENIIKQTQAVYYSWNNNGVDVIYLRRGVSSYQILSGDGKFFC